jgi:Tfp pilus assembly protein PilW
MTMKHRARGISIAELMISLGVLLLVLGMATALFTRAYTHHTLTSENMSNEQEARLAMGKINSSLSQASIDQNATDFPGAASFPILPTPFPDTTATPAIAFFRVTTLNPAVLPSPGGEPTLTYNVHIISYDAVNKVVNEYVTDWLTYSTNGASPAPIVLARNVTDFGVTRNVNDTYEYQFQITVNDIQNATGVEAESPYTLIDNVHILQN